MNTASARRIVYLIPFPEELPYWLIHSWEVEPPIWSIKNR